MKIWYNLVAERLLTMFNNSKVQWQCASIYWPALLIFLKSTFLSWVESPFCRMICLLKALISLYLHVHFTNRVRVILWPSSHTCTSNWNIVFWCSVGSDGFSYPLSIIWTPVYMNKDHVLLNSFSDKVQTKEEEERSVADHKVFMYSDIKADRNEWEIWM